MKKIALLVVFLFASICWGQSTLVCNLPPGGPSHGTLATCSLPIVAVDSCIRYQAKFGIGGGGFTGNIAVNLNTSNAQNIDVPPSGNVVILHGTICNNGSQQTQWTLFDPAIVDASLLLTNTSNALLEDLSVASLLTISATAQRGFGVSFQGGTVEVLKP